jgi:glycosyltransferase involved in cell wall biosynthesis
MDNKEPIRVFVVEQRGSGGMIHYAYQLCTAMAQAGADVTLVTSKEYELANYPHNFTINRLMKLWSLTDPLLSKPPGKKLDAIWRKIYWTGRRGIRAIRLITQWMQLTNYLVKAKPDVIQFGSTEFPFEDIFLRHLKNKGIYLSQICHEFEQRDNEKKLTSILNRKFYSHVFQNFSAIFLHGEANRKRFLELFHIPNGNLHLIPHGNERIFQAPTNTENAGNTLIKKYGIAPQDKTILFFGNITPSKGVSILIDAFKLVYAQDKKVKLIIAGMPSREMNMRNLFSLASEQVELGAVIFDTRYIPMEEVGQLMQLATVVVYPYLNSTQSGALQTAYAFGKPVITTNVGGLPEAVDDGLSGYLVPPNSPEMLGNAIIKIISNPRLVKKMGEYGMQLSKTRFAWESIASQILDIYRNDIYGLKS